MKHIIEDDIYEIVFAAIEEYNQMQDEEDRIEKKPAATIIKDGSNKGLDTDEIVNFLICVDELLDDDQRTVGIPFNMNQILEDKKNILRNVESLVKHIYTLSQK